MNKNNSKIVAKILLISVIFATIMGTFVKTGSAYRVEYVSHTYRLELSSTIWTEITMEVEIHIYSPTSMTYSYSQSYELGPGASWPTWPSWNRVWTVSHANDKQRATLHAHGTFWVFIFFFGRTFDSWVEFDENTNIFSHHGSISNPIQY